MEKERKTDSKPRSNVIGKIIQFTSICLISLVLECAAILSFARLRNRAKTRIRTEKGIQEQLYARIGGIRQYLSIRGNDRSNPVILFLHGGPAGPMGNTGSRWQTGLEDRFTIVHWDQRGCGRTYYENKGAPLPTTSLLLSDMDAIVDYLCDNLKQQKIIIMGHSWGSMLGTLYIQLHPEKVAAYIGVGQGVNMMQGDIDSAQYAIELARKAGKEKEAEQLQVFSDEYVVSFSGDEFERKSESLGKLRSLSYRFLPREGVKSIMYQLWLGLSSPDTSWRDAMWFLSMASGNETLKSINQGLVEDCFAFDIHDVPSVYKMPVYYVMGIYDWTTPLSLVREYAKGIKAPAHQLIILDKAGHSPFFDNPDAFCEAVNDLAIQPTD